MLYAEALRFGPHDQIFLDTVRDVLDSVAPVIDRWPQYAWVAKRLLEAERVSVAGRFFYRSPGDQPPVDIGGFLFCFVFTATVLAAPSTGFNLKRRVCFSEALLFVLAPVLLPLLCPKSLRFSKGKLRAPRGTHTTRYAPTVRTPIRFKLRSIWRQATVTCIPRILLSVFMQLAVNNSFSPCLNDKQSGTRCVVSSVVFLTSQTHFLVDFRRPYPSGWPGWTTRVSSASTAGIATSTRAR